MFTFCQYVMLLTRVLLGFLKCLPLKFALKNVANWPVSGNGLRSFSSSKLTFSCDVDNRFDSILSYALVLPSHSIFVWVITTKNYFIENVISCFPPRTFLLMFIQYFDNGMFSLSPWNANIRKLSREIMNRVNLEISFFGMGDKLKFSSLRTLFF